MTRKHNRTPASQETRISQRQKGKNMRSQSKTPVSQETPKSTKRPLSPQSPGKQTKRQDSKESPITINDHDKNLTAPDGARPLQIIDDGTMDDATSPVELCDDIQDKGPALDKSFTADNRSFASVVTTSPCQNKSPETDKPQSGSKLTTLGTPIAQPPRLYIPPQKRINEDNRTENEEIPTNNKENANEKGSAKKQIVFILNKNGPVAPQNLEEKKIREILQQETFKNEEIESIRINTKGKRVTALIAPKTEKAKQNIEEIKRTGKTLTANINDQIRWELTVAPIRAIGVIKGLRTEETEEQIREKLEKIPEVITARNLGRYNTTWSLSLRTSELPKSIVTPYGRKNVQPYANQTLNCPRCMQSGHRAVDCPDQAITCAKCGKKGHGIKDCTEQSPQCPKCHGKHTGFDPKCPRNQKEAAEKKEKIIELKEKREKQIKEKKQNEKLDQIANLSKKDANPTTENLTEKINELTENLENIIQKIVKKELEKVKDELLKQQEKQINEFIEKAKTQQTVHTDEIKEHVNKAMKEVIACNTKETYKTFKQMQEKIKVDMIQTLRDSNEPDEYDISEVSDENETSENSSFESSGTCEIDTTLTEKIAPAQVNDNSN